jgi:hypothetical protein
MRGSALGGGDARSGRFNEMPLFPKGDTAYTRVVGHGTLVKLYEYNLTSAVEHPAAQRPSAQDRSAAARTGAADALREGLSRTFITAGRRNFWKPARKRLAGDTARAATSDEVKDLRREASALKEVVAELMLENRLLKKSTIGAGEDGA